MNYFKDSELFSDYNLQELTENAKKIVLSAGKLALEKFSELESLQIETKAPGDFVSEADKQVEVLLRELLLAKFPDFLVFGEEGGWADLEVDKSAPVWVVDPIDGTTPFISGLPSWCISVSLCINNIPAIGIIYAPAYNELYVAYQGGGCTLNGKKVNVHENNMRKFGIGHSNRAVAKSTTQFFNKLMQCNMNFYNNGSGALMLAYVASGKLLGYYEGHLNSWDCAAGIRLVLESGAKVIDFNLENFITSGSKVLCGNKKILEELEKS